MNFPTKEKLELMPLIRLRLLDVTTKEEEELLQEVIYKKMSNAPLAQPISVSDIQAKMDKERNMTPEKELEYQKMMDERVAKIRGVKDEKVLPKPFCEFCDSKGVRHKKECTRQK